MESTPTPIDAIRASAGSCATEAEPASLRTRLWQPNLIVFVSSACIMILELVASRIIAPYVGVSLWAGGWPITGLPCASWGASSCSGQGHAFQGES